MLHPLVGHEVVRSSLAGARRRGTLPDALLLHGPAGVGKQRLALWLGQLVLCEAPGGDGPCGACRSCTLALRLEHPDLHWHFPLARPSGVAGDKLGDALEEARYARLTELRARSLQPPSVEDASTAIYLAAAQKLRRRAQSRPAMCDAQVFIIADAERLVPQESSPEAANALLKLLEEPPRDTRFILTSSEPGSLLDTIRSRTVPVHVPPLPVARVATFLVEQGVEPAAAERAARLGRGAIGRSLGFLPADDGSKAPLDAVQSGAWELLEAALAGGPGPGMRLALAQAPAGARSLLPTLSALEDWLRDLGAVAAGVPDRAIATDAVERLEALVRASGVRAEAVSRAIPAVDDAALQARGNVNPQLVVAGLVHALRDRLLAGAPT